VHRSGNFFTFLTEIAIYLGDTEPWLQWVANRNSQVAEQSVSVLITLSDRQKRDTRNPIFDLEQPNLAWKRGEQRLSVVLEGQTCHLSQGSVAAAFPSFFDTIYLHWLCTFWLKEIKLGMVTHTWHHSRGSRMTCTVKHWVGAPVSLNIWDLPHMPTRCEKQQPHFAQWIKLYGREIFTGLTTSLALAKEDVCLLFVYFSEMQHSAYARYTSTIKILVVQ